MGAYSTDEKLLMHFFQDNLAGAAVAWYTNLEASQVQSWKDLATAFIRKGKFEYASNTGPNSNRRAPVVGTRKKEGDTHAVTTTPTWMKMPQNAQNSYQHNHLKFSI